MKLIVLGLPIILIGVFSFFFYPVIRAEINLFLMDNNYFEMQIAVVERKTRQIAPLDEEFGIVINKIAANGKVIDFFDANDSPFSPYILSTGLIHLSDSAYPGEVGNMVIISQAPGDWYNTTRSNPEFYLSYKLLPKDVIQVFYKGEEFDYLVTNIFKIREDQVKDFTRKSDQKLLTILSGWPPGTTLKRLIITAEMKERVS